jgi:hypothetical protein
MRRSPAPGLSYVDANMGLVEEGPDVTECKVRLKELDSNLNAYYDTIQKEWIVTQFVVQRNQEEFLLADEDLARAYQRVLRARNDAPGALSADELNKELDRSFDEYEDKQMQVFREIASDAGERLVHAFKKDGLMDHENIYGPTSPVSPQQAARTIRRTVDPRKGILYRDPD